MRRRVCIHQPDFIPWLGFFHRLQRSDLYLALDDVQFIRRGWQNRDRIRSSKGVAWLTVPVKKKGRYLQRLIDVEIDYSHCWQKKHLGVLEMTYGRTPGYKQLSDKLAEILSQKQKFLVDLNLEIISLMNKELKVDIEVLRVSDLVGDRIGIPDSLNPSERLAQLTELVGGKTYLTGSGSRGYLKEDFFNSKGITVEWQEFKAPVSTEGDKVQERPVSGLDWLFINPGRSPW